MCVSYFGIRMSFTIVNYKLKYQNVNYRIFFPHLKLVEDSDDNKHACHWINISDVNMLTFDLIHFDWVAYKRCKESFQEHWDENDKWK